MAIKATLTKEKAAELTKQFGKSEKDTGNTKVQVALLTERIRNLTEHVKVHRKDVHSTRGLIILVAKRRKNLNYVKARDINEYRKLIKELGLRR
jgi:small subunit ribosomal protein S15